MTKARKKSLTESIPINAADQRALRCLPGVGKMLARAIWIDREHAGPFQHMDDLVARVPGIGPVMTKRLQHCVHFSLALATQTATDTPHTVHVQPRPDSMQQSNTQAPHLPMRAEITSPAIDALNDDDEIERYACDAFEADHDQIMAPDGWAWTDGQIQAIRAIRRHLRTRRGEIFVLKGFAGTGKTSLLVEALRTFAPPLMLAPTHKAKSILAPKAELLAGQADTVHRWLGYRAIVNESTGHEVLQRAPRDPKYRPHEAVPIVIDEVSLLGETIWAEILDEVRLYGLMCVAMGDPLQLPPVGETESPAFKLSSAIELTEVKRSQGVLTEIVLEMRRRIAQIAPLRITQPVSDAVGCVELFHDKTLLLQRYLEDIQAGRDAILLAWTNRVVKWANQWLRARIVGQHQEPFVPGELVVVTQSYRLDLPGDWKHDTRTRPMLYTETRLRIVDAVLGQHPFWGDACWILKVRPLGFFASDGLAYETSNSTLHIPVYALDFQQQAEFHKRVSKLDQQFAHLCSVIEQHEHHAKENKNAQSYALLDHLHAQRSEFAHKLASYRAAFINIRPSYATTVHKSQGCTWSDVYVIQSDIENNGKHFERNRLLYVAFSRAARRLVIYR